MSSDGEFTCRKADVRQKKGPRNVNQNNSGCDQPKQRANQRSREVEKVNGTSKNSSLESVHSESLEFMLIIHHNPLCTFFGLILCLIATSHAASTSSSRSSMSIEEDIHLNRARAIKSSSPVSDSKDFLVFKVCACDAPFHCSQNHL